MQEEDPRDESKSGKTLMKNKKEEVLGKKRQEVFAWGFPVSAPKRAGRYEKLKSFKGELNKEKLA